MLSTAAGLDFKQRIILVQARGDRVAALRLWQSVGMGTVSRFRGCPPFCTCAHGGMRVAWSGMMTSPSCSCLRRMPMPRGAQRWPRHGWPGIRAADAGGCSSGGGTACSIPERGGEPRPRWPCSRTILLRFCGMWSPGGGADGLSCHEAVRGVDPGPQGKSGKLHAGGEHSICSPSRRGQPSSMPSRPGLRCARAWKEGVVLSLPSMWMSTLSFSTELQHRRGLWHH